MNTRALHNNSQAIISIPVKSHFPSNIHHIIKQSKVILQLQNNHKSSIKSKNLNKTTFRHRLKLEL